MYKIKQLSENFHEIRVRYSRTQNEFWFLLGSDHHFDNVDCRRDMVKRHLEQCKEKGALALMFGDFFCAMQGKYDKRSDKSKVRPEHQNGRYLDSLVETGADYLMPYRQQIGLIGMGNHETAIINKHETDLITRLVEALNGGSVVGGHKVHKGGYGGYIRLVFEQAGGGGGIRSVLIKYYHGTGGGGIVTHGVIQSQRMAAMLTDADIVVCGHVHERYIMSYMRERTTQRGKIEHHEQFHVRTPTYKDEYKQGAGGWHVESGKPPKPLGAYWLKVNINRHDVEFDFLMAR